MTTQILVLGGGMVGSVIAQDLATQAGFEVTVADARSHTVDTLSHIPKLRTMKLDASSLDALGRAVKPFDVVVGALPSAMGFRTLRTMIELRKPYCDISFMAEDAIDLDGFAKEKGSLAIVDCGVGPGISSVVAGHATRELDPCESLTIYVGGLPLVRRWPFEYKAPFAPSDVIEEYVRPSRIVENGKVVVKEALSEPELIDFPGIGTLEAFNTDGLRSLARTLSVPQMKEKTLRYPGHIALMRVLRESGFFSTEPIEVGGASIRPRDLTAKLLFPRWTFEPKEADVTIMRIEVVGQKGGKRTRLTWDLHDTYDPETGFRSMSRTTGFPASVVAAMLARGEIQRTGVVPPELLGMEPGFLERFLGELRKRSVFLDRSETILSP